MTTSSGNIWILFITILFLGLTGCSGTRPDSFLDEENSTQSQEVTNDFVEFYDEIKEEQTNLN